MNFVNGYVLEPNGVDISKNWVAVDASQDYSLELTGEAGSTYTVWRF